LPDTPQLGLKKVHCVRFKVRLEQGQRCSQTPDRDAHLMHTFGVAGQGRRLICQQVAERGTQNLLQCFRCTSCSFE
jgi:hypothetical protein